MVAYRFYGAFLAAKIAVLNDRRSTPAHRLRDDVDYQPTRRLVLFGVHFAAIAGAGPLVGPVLASQWGYFPGFCWIVVGSCLAGGVHDFVVLLASVRQDGKSLPKLIQNLLGPIAGTATTLAVLFIIITTLAATAKVVVNALNESAWGMFTIMVTIPAALLTGFYMYKIRPGRVGEATFIGMTIVLLGVIFGKTFDDSTLREWLIFTPKKLSVILPVYAAVVSILPVWVLLCPRDYLSSFMKVGVIVLLAVGIFVAHPALKMPATTVYVHGGGPITGTVWPFVCIVIACGALSGFHALVSSGTTPKMIDKETDMRAIGYGAMLMEGFVSLTALVAACALEPGDYFKINTEKAKYEILVQDALANHNWDLRPVEFDKLKQEAGVKEDLSGRTAGAVSLALGMAKILGDLPGMRILMAYLYHFVIMFEALFILTLLETGTRIARFIFQETLAQFKSHRSDPHAPQETTWTLNIIVSAVVSFLWGYLLYTGDIDRLWRMMGISNQMLATIGLAAGTTYILRYSARRAYALCTGLPFAFVVVTVFTAGVESVLDWWNQSQNPKLPQADVFSNQLMSVLAAIILVLGAIVVIESVRRWYLLLTNGTPRDAAELALDELV